VLVCNRLLPQRAGSACRGSRQAEADAAADPRPPLRRQRLAPSPHPHHGTHGNNGHDYTCEDGVKLNAKIQNGTILLTMDGKAQT
jgi:hypothetical protein